MINEEYIYFSSGSKAPYDQLSNFAQFDVLYENILYPSSEHAFQAQLVPFEYREKLFSVQGLFGTLEKGFINYYSKCGKKNLTEKDEITIKKKMRYWGGKPHLNKPAKIGIVAKLVSNRKWLKNNLCIDKIDIGPVLAKKIFIEILNAKYLNNSEPRQILLQTFPKYLCEFSRSAERETKRGKPPRWTGMIVNGVLMGQNQQGYLQMIVRNEIIQKNKSQV